MGRRPRLDEPGSWHHVINRGLAKRPLFEDRHDIRYFLSRLAREVRKGNLEIHCWTILTTHFHLLVRSPRGALSDAMRRAQNSHARAFNRRHRRDGTIVRGRYMSKPVDCDVYLATLVRYIDDNAVKARLVDDASDYPWCSASQYFVTRRPRWLSTYWIEREVAAEWVNGATFQERYLARFGRSSSSAATRLVERRLATPSPANDGFDHLLRAAPNEVAAWLRRKTKLADGATNDVIVTDLESVERAVLVEAKAGAIPPARRAGSLADPAFVARVGLQRRLAGARWHEIASRTDRSVATCSNALLRHEEWIEKDPAYRTFAGRAGRRAILMCLGAPGRGTPPQTAPGD